MASVIIDRWAIASARCGLSRVSSRASDSDDIASSSLDVLQARNAVSMAGFLRKWIGGRAPSTTPVAGLAFFDGDAHPVQAGKMAQGGGDDDAGMHSLAARLRILGLDFGRLAGKGRIDDVVERDRGGVRHHRHDVVYGDAVAAVNIECKFLQLVARCLAIAA